MATRGAAFDVDIKNMGQVQRALKLVDDKVEREIGLALNKKGRTIRDEARGAVPSRPDQASGWSSRPPEPRYRLNLDGTWNRAKASSGWPAWNVASIKSSIKSTRRAWKLTISMSDRAGAIYATAFTKTDGTNPQGRNLRGALQSVNKSRRGARSGRILVPALRKHYRATLDELENGVRRAAKIIEGRING